MDSTALPARFAPSRIAPETFVIHHRRLVDDGLLPVNVMVIRGAEPVLVDTGDGGELLDDVFGVVEPADIRWVFVSNDDADHIGNLAAILDAAPHAVAVLDPGLCRRRGAALAVPAGRRLLVGDGQRFEAGDRRLVAVRPPVYGSPATRGLYDPTTGVYWSADAFACVVAAEVADVAALDAVTWAEAMAAEQQRIAPWLALVDDRRFQASVDRVDGLAASAVAGSHTPVIRRGRVDAALAITRRAPALAW